MTASDPACENSYMLPHGGRPAEIPRVTTAPRCSAKASTVSETAIRPRRPARARRASAHARSSCAGGTAAVGRRPPVPTPRRRSRARGPRPAPGPAGADGASRTRARRRSSTWRRRRPPSRSRRRLLLRWASVSALTRCTRPVARVVVQVSVASVPAIEPASSRDLVGERPRRPRPRAPGPPPRRAYARPRRLARTQTRRRRTNSESIRPASASTRGDQRGRRARVVRDLQRGPPPDPVERDRLPRRAASSSGPGPATGRTACPSSVRTCGHARWCRACRPTGRPRRRCRGRRVRR